MISGMGPGQRNLHHNFSHIEDRSGWRQNTRARTNISTFDNRSRGTGPRHGGTFGALVPGQGYAYAEMYPSEATIDPDRQPKSGDLISPLAMESRSRASTAEPGMVAGKRILGLLWRNGVVMASLMFLADLVRQ